MKHFVIYSYYSEFNIIECENEDIAIKNIESLIANGYFMNNIKCIKGVECKIEPVEKVKSVKLS